MAVGGCRQQTGKQTRREGIISDIVAGDWQELCDD